MLLQNQKRQNRKGGKFTYKWIGSYTIKSISKTGLCVLVNEKDVILKKKYNVSLLKPFSSKADPKQSDEEDKRQSDDREKKQQQKPDKNYFD